jgi:hypothetical protein
MKYRSAAESIRAPAGATSASARAACADEAFRMALAFDDAAARSSTKTICFAVGMPTFATANVAECQFSDSKMLNAHFGEA